MEHTMNKMSRLYALNGVSLLQHIEPQLHETPSNDTIKLGVAAIDRRLQGGLGGAGLHEFYSTEPDDGAAAAGFALLLSLRVVDLKPIIWVRECRCEARGGQLYAPGLTELGADIERLIIVSAPDPLAVLRAGADIAGCGAVGVLVLEPSGRAPAFDHTASRRLALASARTGVTTLVVRSGAEPIPSAAQTRWRIGAAPSRALPANAPGPPVFDISLLRHRGGIAGFDARVEWDRDRRSFRDAPLSGGIPADAICRTGAEDQRRAA